MTKMKLAQKVDEKQIIYLGIDVHKKRWVVTVRSYDLELKTFSMFPIAEELDNSQKIRYFDWVLINTR